MRFGRQVITKKAAMSRRVIAGLPSSGYRGHSKLMKDVKFA